METDGNTRTITQGRSLPGLYDIKKLWNPSWFQGNRRRGSYFEGWYFKIVSPCGRHSRAFIPGVSISSDDSHAFVQAIDGMTGQSWYFRFPLEGFSYSRNGFAVKIGRNRFSASHMELHLAGQGATFSGRLGFEGRVCYPAGLTRPGIMGWYRYMPFMECYHGVVSLDHEILGGLELNGKEVRFSGGRGYIEKDWGTSMPSAWVWMQANHFETRGTSFMLSVANIPWIGKSFTGFLGYFLHEGRRYDFATHTGARITRLEKHEGRILVGLQGKGFRIEVGGLTGNTGALKAPVGGTMQRLIHESIDASLEVRLSDGAGKTLFRGTSRHAGLELTGQTDTLRP
jgi:hypothetical protein